MSKIKMYGTVEAWVNKKDMKQPDKFEILFNEFKNMDNKFTNAIETLDTKFTNAIGEIKIEIKEIKNDIVDIKKILII